MSVEASNENLLPLFFGRDEDLYGVCHLAQDPAQAPALVICQPTGHEYERCHRAMRQLAVQAAKKGISAMRFDYYATGDSAGLCEELSLRRMREDGVQAIDSCRARTGVSLLTLVGLRLGATLAAQLACERADVESLVLYAPVLDGAELLEDWQRDQREYFARHNQLTAPQADDEILGFRLNDNFRQELRQKFELPTPGQTLKRVLLLSDQAQLDGELLSGWISHFTEQGVDITLEAVDDIEIWRREPMDAIVPAKTIRRIVKWLREA